MWWFPIASMSETTKGTCSSWGTYAAYTQPHCTIGGTYGLPLPTCILYHKKRPLQSRGLEVPTFVETARTVSQSYLESELSTDFTTEVYDVFASSIFVRDTRDLTIYR